MFRTILWATIFFVVAFLIAIQPACHGWSDKPTNKVMLRVRGDLGLGRP